MLSSGSYMHAHPQTHVHWRTSEHTHAHSYTPTPYLLGSQCSHFLSHGCSQHFHLQTRKKILSSNSQSCPQILDLIMTLKKKATGLLRCWRQTHTCPSRAVCSGWARRSHGPTWCLVVLGGWAPLW